MNIFEKINAMPRGCGIRDVSVGRLDGLTTDDLKSLVSVIETAEEALEKLSERSGYYIPTGHVRNVAAEALKTIRTTKGEE